MRGYGRLTIGLTVLILTFFASTMGFAIDLGLDSPRNWQGNGARVQSYDINWENQTVKDISLTTIKDNTTQATYSENGGYSYIYGWGQSTYKVLKGSVDASGYDSYLWQAGGYYRDEIFFSTANGLAADLAITFNVSATGSTYDVDTATAFLSMGWGLYYPDAYFPLGVATLIDLAGANQLGEYNGTVTMHTSNAPYPESILIKSGTYVPFSLSVWGTVSDGTLDWGDTVGFANFTAFQNGVQLNSDQFTIVEGGQGAPVPEPTTMLLLGSGLIGLAGYGRKKFFKK